MGIAMHKAGELTKQDFVLGLDAGQFSAWQELVYDSSGGDPAIFFSDSSGQQRELIFLRTITSVDTPTEKPRQDSLADILEEIRSTFGLSQSELAEICGLTRKSLYDWQKGARPRKKSAERLGRLHRAAMDWRRSGFPVPDGSRLHMPVLRDASLFDLLKADPLDPESIHFGGARMSLGNANEQEISYTDPFLLDQ
jgi:DNA-binding transcriptional regulator YiaG